MSDSCHATETPTLERKAVQRIALAGNPNAGKTTVFNLLTGLRQRVGNYPGVTVERKTGTLLGDDKIEVVDLPGTYSLNPRSPDEQIAYDVLVGRVNGEAPPTLVVCVVDATNLERNLYLATQIIDLGLPTIVVLNMMDEVEESGVVIDTEVLESELGTPVIPMAAARKRGLDELRAAINGHVPEALPIGWRLMPAAEGAVSELEAALEARQPHISRRARRGEALRLLGSEDALAYWQKEDPLFHSKAKEIREELSARKVPFESAEVLGRYEWLREVISRVSTRRKEEAPSVSDRLDSVLTHKVAGPIIFAAILLLVFQAIFSWATPAMDLIEATVLSIGTFTRAQMPAGFLTDLLVDGVIAGVGSVIVFLPQILLLFFFLGLMENTGYMARTAFIMDRLMRRVGLTGGSVVPMMSAFACAIPGIMAARTMDNERDRIVTIMVVPLMSCSARLPVYTLFIAAFIPQTQLFGPIGAQGLAMFSLYALGTVMAFIAAWVLKRFVMKGSNSFFMMELPPYRAPQMKLVLWRMYERAKVFVKSAGKIILLCSIIIWFLASYPKPQPSADLMAREAAIEQTLARNAIDGTNEEQNEALTAELEQIGDQISAHQMEYSLIGRMGRAIEPVMEPLGFDWKLSAGIISAFAAREVIVSALGTIYSVGDADENSVALRDRLRTDRDPVTGRLTYTPLVAVSLMVFFVLAMQCMSTLAVARRELNSWFWPAVMWTYMTGLAYLFALVVYQGGMMLGWG